MSLRVLVTDLGQVILPFQEEIVWRRLEQYCQVSPIPRERVKQLVLETGLEKGDLSGRDFYELLVPLLQMDLSYPDFVEVWSDMFWVEERTLNLLLQARVHLRFILSNTNPIHWEWLSRRFSWLWEHFDKIFLSYEWGLLKPDPVFFREVVKASGFSPSEHLFIDDNPENIQGALQIGMRGLVYRDPENLEAGLKSFGLL